MNPTDLQERTYKFALASIAFYRRLPKSQDAQVLGLQYLRSATSEWSNYRATRRARSRAEFIAKLGNVVEEADESVGWLELLRDLHSIFRYRARRRPALTSGFKF